jgi:hypothetical protein
LSSLYTTGEVRLTGTDEGGVADYNGNGAVEQGDLDLVLLHWGSELSDPSAAGWNNHPPIGPIDQGELDDVLLFWGNSRMSPAAASIPEPATWIMAVLFCGATLISFSQRSRRIRR